MFNINAAFSNVQGTREAITRTQMSSARYYQRPDNDYTNFDTTRTSLSGSGGRMQVMKLNGHWNFIGATIWKTPGFETNDLGYIRQADQILNVIWAGYNQWEPKGFYRSYNINFDYIQCFKLWRGLALKGDLRVTAIYNFKNYWNTFTGGNISTPQLSTGMLQGRTYDEDAG